MCLTAASQGDSTGEWCTAAVCGCNALARANYLGCAFNLNAFRFFLPRFSFEIVVSSIPIRLALIHLTSAASVMEQPKDYRLLNGGGVSCLREVFRENSFRERFSKRRMNVSVKMRNFR